MFGLLAKNTTAQIIAKVISVATAVILIRLTTENLGKEGYGIYSFVMAIVLLFGTIADWGTNIIAVREAAQNKEKQREIFGAAFTLRFLLSFAAGALLNVVVRVYPPWHEFINQLTVGSLVLLFLSIKSSISIVFQTFLKFEWVGLAEIVNSLIFLALAAIFLIQGGGVVEVLFAWVLGTAAAAFVSFLVAIKIAKINFSAFPPDVIRRLIKESLPMGLFLVFFSIYNRVDIIILEHFKGIENVAVYNLAYKIHDNLVLGAAFLMGSAFPVLSRMYAKGDTGSMIIFYRKLLGITALGGMAVAITFFVLAPLVIRVLTGEQFVQFGDSVTALKILIFATFISYLNHLTGYSLIAFGKQKIILFVGTVALVFNVIANMIFIPNYSWTAAATVTVFTELIVFLLTSYFISATIFKRHAQT